MLHFSVPLCVVCLFFNGFQSEIYEFFFSFELGRLPGIGGGGGGGRGRKGPALSFRPPCALSFSLPSLCGINHLSQENFAEESKVLVRVLKRSY